MKHKIEMLITDNYGSWLAAMSHDIFMIRPIFSKRPFESQEWAAFSTALASYGVQYLHTKPGK